MSYSFYFIFNELKDTHGTQMPTSTKLWSETVIKVHKEMSGTF